MRIVGIHILRPPKIFWPFYHFGKFFLNQLNQKILNRVYFHADFESLHKYFNKEFLPESLGGDLTEENAAETHVVKQILQEDIPYEGKNNIGLGVILSFYVTYINFLVYRYIYSISWEMFLVYWNGAIWNK